jgi:ribosome-associated protein
MAPSLARPEASEQQEIAAVQYAMIVDPDAAHDSYYRHAGARRTRLSGALRPGVRSRGQNVNKVATAVELRFNVSASSIPDEVKQRLISLAGHRMTSEGELLIDSREHRTQAQNREAARARLVALLQQAAKRPKKRTPTRPRPAARERRLASKKRRSTVKKFRGKAGAGEE